MSNHPTTEALIRRYYDAMQRVDLDAIWACYADNIVYEDAALGHVFNGLEETKAFYLNYMMALEVKVSIDSLLTTDDGYAIAFIMEGCHSQDLPNLPATHKRFTLKGATLGRVAGGKITHNADYWNLAALLSQLGLA